MFYLDRWLAIRPDEVVTDEYFKQVQNDFREDPQNLAVNFTRRVHWDDGLDKRPDPELEHGKLTSFSDS